MLQKMWFLSAVLGAGLLLAGAGSAWARNPVPTAVRHAMATGGGGYEAPPPPPNWRWIDSHFTAAEHPNAADVWLASGYDHAADATAAALRACEHAMGPGCSTAITGRNQAVAVAWDYGHGLYYATDLTESRAAERVEQYCQEKSQAPCVAFRTHTASPRAEYLAMIGVRVNPLGQVISPQGEVHRRWAMTARTDVGVTGPQRDGTVWISGGHASREQAEAAVLEACRRDSGKPCEALSRASNAPVYVAVNPEGLLALGSAADMSVMELTIQRHCWDRDRTTCELKTIFPATRGQTLSVQPRTAPTLTISDQRDAEAVTRIGTTIQTLTRDPEFIQLRAGYWTQHQSDAPGQRCAATFANLDGMMTLSGSGGPGDAALLMLAGSSIPKPDEVTQLRVTLHQEGAAPQSVTAFNWADSPEGFGTLGLVVPTLQAAMDGFLDRSTLAVEVDSRRIYDLTYHGGTQAVANLRRCSRGEG